MLSKVKITAILIQYKISVEILATFTGPFTGTNLKL
jgi:hypothetical protein